MKFPNPPDHPQGDGVEDHEVVETNQDRIDSSTRSTKYERAAEARADAQGQISIHLDCNFLLVMYAEM